MRCCLSQWVVRTANAAVDVDAAAVAAVVAAVCQPQGLVGETLLLQCSFCPSIVLVYAMTGWQPWALIVLLYVYMVVVVMGV